MMVGLFFATLASNAFAYYNPGQGRWLSRDPAEEPAGVNLYSYVANQPIGRVDSHGLWGRDIHEFATTRWAKGFGYPDQAAAAIGAADEAVDHGTKNWMPIWGDQSYHFDRNKGVGKDTRIKHYEDHLKLAKEACTNPKDDPITAARQLGTALHPYQDWVAHGDYGFTDDGAIWFDGIHNKHSPQATTWGDVSSYPDNPMLDAVGGPNGRPAAPAMRTVIINFGVSVREYAIYQPGTQRYRLTKSMTEAALQDFRSHVRRNAIPSCKCIKYFGLSSTP